MILLALVPEPETKQATRIGASPFGVKMGWGLMFPIQLGSPYKNWLRSFLCEAQTYRDINPTLSASSPDPGPAIIL